MLHSKLQSNSTTVTLDVDSRSSITGSKWRTNIDATNPRVSSYKAALARDSTFFDDTQKPKRSIFAWVPRKQITTVLDSWQYQSVTLLLIFYSLFAVNLTRIVQASDSVDPYIDAFLIMCIVVFLIEIILVATCRPRPPWTLLCLDLIATLSIVVDLSWVTEAANFDEANGSKTSEAAVVSARAGRIVRLVRLLRLLRTVSILSRIANQAMQARKAADSKGAAGTTSKTAGVQSGAPSNIGGKLTDALVMQVAIFIILMVICTALLTSWGVQASPYDAYVSSFAAMVGAPQEVLQGQVDSMLQFSDEYASKQTPLALTVGNETWNWVEEQGGWPKRASAAAEFRPSGSEEDTVLLIVDVSDQDAQDALQDSLLIIMVLIALLVYVAVLNVTIYRTLVRPLERIFNTIRTNAAQVVAALGNPNDGENPSMDTQGDEDGDLQCIEAAVEKMSRILAHASTPGQQGSHLARTMAQGADNSTKEWLATMVGESVKDSTATGETNPSQALGASPMPGGSVASKVSAAVLNTARNVRFSLIGSDGVAEAAAAAAADALGPTDGRSSGASMSTISKPNSRAATGSFGGLSASIIDRQSFPPLATMAAFGAGLTDEQKGALLAVDLDELHSFRFDVLTLPPEALAPHIVSMFIQLDLATFSTNAQSRQMQNVSSVGAGFIDVGTLWRFIDAVFTFYRQETEVPYHNLYHCADVTHAVFLLLDRLRAPASLTPLECFATLVAALAHDMDHPGVNNAYLVNARDPLALTYNDASVLENRHVACLYALVSAHPEVDIFRELDSSQWKEVRKMVIAAILHTDMTQHFPMVSKLEVFLELKAADIQAAHSQQRAALRGRSGLINTQSDLSFAALSAATAAYAGATGLPCVFTTAEERTLLLCVIMHCADISNPARPAHIAEKWADRVLSEFFAQGDKERAANQPISPMCDRATTSRAASQINFLEFVVAPLFSLVVKIFPDAGELLENASATRQFWQAALVAEMMADASKTIEEKQTEVQKYETRAGAFLDKYKDTMTTATRRKRDLRKRLSTISSVASASTGDANISNGEPLNCLAYIPTMSQSARNSSSSTATTPLTDRKGSGSMPSGSPLSPCPKACVPLKAMEKPTRTRSKSLWGKNLLSKFDGGGDTSKGQRAQMQASASTGALVSAPDENFTTSFINNDMEHGDTLV